MIISLLPNHVPVLYLGQMERLDPSTLASTILTAPGWVRVGITAPVQRIREQAAHELARAICETVHPAIADDRSQLPLPL